MEIRGLEAGFGYGNTDSSSILFINITRPYKKKKREREIYTVRPVVKIFRACSYREAHRKKKVPHISYNCGQA